MPLMNFAILNPHTSQSSPSDSTPDTLSRMFCWIFLVSKHLHFGVLQSTSSSTHIPPVPLYPLFHFQGCLSRRYKRGCPCLQIPNQVHHTSIIHRGYQQIPRMFSITDIIPARFSVNPGMAKMLRMQQRLDMHSSISSAIIKTAKLEW